ncbi:MAG: PLDc N-terminal domain-containing protein, partial [Nanoarchaeota archaeon]
MLGLNNILFWPIMAAFTAAGIILGLLILAFWIWIIIDCAKRKFKNDLEKIIWILIIIFTNWIGALAYLIVIKIYNQKGLVKNK